MSFTTIDVYKKIPHSDFHPHQFKLKKKLIVWSATCIEIGYMSYDMQKFYIMNKKCNTDCKSFIICIVKLFFQFLWRKRALNLIWDNNYKMDPNVLECFKCKQRMLEY